MRNLLDYCPEPVIELSLIVGFTLFFKNHMFLLILNLKLKLIATYFVIIYFLWLSFTFYRSWFSLKFGLFVRRTPTGFDYYLEPVTRVLLTRFCDSMNLNENVKSCISLMRWFQVKMQFFMTNNKFFKLHLLSRAGSISFTAKKWILIKSFSIKTIHILKII